MNTREIECDSRFTWDQLTKLATAVGLKHEIVNLQKKRNRNGKLTACQTLERRIQDKSFTLAFLRNAGFEVNVANQAEVDDVIVEEMTPDSETKDIQEEIKITLNPVEQVTLANVVGQTVTFMKDDLSKVVNVSTTLSEGTVQMFWDSLKAAIPESSIGGWLQKGFDAIKGFLPTSMLSKFKKAGNLMVQTTIYMYGMAYAMIVQLLQNTRFYFLLSSVVLATRNVACRKFLSDVFGKRLEVSWMEERAGKVKDMWADMQDWGKVGLDAAKVVLYSNLGLYVRSALTYISGGWSSIAGYLSGFAEKLLSLPAVLSSVFNFSSEVFTELLTNGLRGVLWFHMLHGTYDNVFRLFTTPCIRDMLVSSPRATTNFWRDTFGYTPLPTTQEEAAATKAYRESHGLEIAAEKFFDTWNNAEIKDYSPEELKQMYLAELAKLDFKLSAEHAKELSADPEQFIVAAAQGEKRETI